MENKMSYNSQVTDLIQRRKSSRTYGKQPLEMGKRELIDSFIKNLKAPFWGNKPRFEIVDVGTPGKGRIAGSYGLIKGAGILLVGAARPGRGEMEDFGYLFEKIILFATDLDIGTCWIGLTFKRGPLAEKIGLSADEFIPTVSPLGYPVKRRPISESVIRASIGAHKRKPWKDLFFDGDWNKSLEKHNAGDYEIPLEMVRLGPSATNKQPWRIVKDNGAFHFFLQRAMGYDKLNDKADMQRIDMGIAMCHFELAAMEKKLNGSWQEKAPENVNLPKNCEYVVSWLGG